MQLVQRHMIKRADSRFQVIDHAAFASKNLYNAANYIVRQSFIDEGVYLNYLGKRVERGLYRAADGRHINADANGSYNIIRKVAPNAFARGRRGCVVHPIRLAV